MRRCFWRTPHREERPSPLPLRQRSNGSQEFPAATLTTEKGTGGMDTRPKVWAVVFAAAATVTACSRGPSRARAAQEYVRLQEQTESQVTSLCSQRHR